MSETFPLYNGEETVKIKGFKCLVIKDSLKNPVVHKPDPNKFKNFIFDLITSRGNINEETAYKLLDEMGMERVKIGFTHSSMIGESNYEFFEMLGDRSVNKAIIWYMHRRFPEISNNENAPMYMTELKKKYENKRNFGAWARKMGFEEFIQYTELSFQQGKYIKTVRINDSMLEDCFESFCGVLEDLIDARIGLGVGYGIIYNIITSLLDEEYITTDLSKLVDLKTQVKELLECAELKKYGAQMTSNSYPPEEGVNTFLTTINLKFTSSPCPKYSGPLDLKFTSSKPNFKKVDSETDASKQLLDWMKTQCGMTWDSCKL
jgi:dsRNA-specific ribonuclease